MWSFRTTDWRDGDRGEIHAAAVNLANAIGSLDEQGAGLHATIAFLSEWADKLFRTLDDDPLAHAAWLAFDGARKLATQLVLGAQDASRKEQSANTGERAEFYAELAANRAGGADEAGMILAAACDLLLYAAERVAMNRR